MGLVPFRLCLERRHPPAVGISLFQDSPSHGVTRFLGFCLDVRFELNADAPEGSKGSVVGEISPFMPRQLCGPDSCGIAVSYLDYKVALLWDGRGRLDEYLRRHGILVEPAKTGEEYLTEMQERRRRIKEHGRQKWEARQLVPAEPIPPRKTPLVFGRRKVRVDRAGVTSVGGRGKGRLRLSGFRIQLR